ncbi:hypothetical protein TNCT_372451 [Trichonephila clavata]|uniref:Transposase n=1 Tax=Trichonephila clavata TaxID=2740835 RepID=A0A8X6J8L8_TRICU|nr:hypothetical protein TNCT_372451 [Trichonephila clavata]
MTDKEQKVRQVLDMKRRISAWRIAENCEIPPNNRSSHFNARLMHSFQLDLAPCNASNHIELIASKLLLKIGRVMLPQPPYCPDLAPQDFFLFPSTLKKLSIGCWER